PVAQPLAFPTPAEPPVAQPLAFPTPVETPEAELPAFPTPTEPPDGANLDFAPPPELPDAASRNASPPSPSTWDQTEMAQPKQAKATPAFDLAASRLVAADPKWQARTAPPGNQPPRLAKPSADAWNDLQPPEPNLPPAGLPEPRTRRRTEPQPPPEPSSLPPRRSVHGPHDPATDLRRRAGLAPRAAVFPPEVAVPPGLPTDPDQVSPVDTSSTLKAVPFALAEQVKRSPTTGPLRRVEVSEDSAREPPEDQATPPPKQPVEPPAPDQLALTDPEATAVVGSPIEADWTGGRTEDLAADWPTATAEPGPGATSAPPAPFGPGDPLAKAGAGPDQAYSTDRFRLPGRGDRGDSKRRTGQRSRPGPGAIQRFFAHMGLHRPGASPVMTVAVLAGLVVVVVGVVWLALSITSNDKAATSQVPTPSAGATGATEWSMAHAVESGGFSLEVTSIEDSLTSLTGDDANLPEHGQFVVVGVKVTRTASDDGTFMADRQALGLPDGQRFFNEPDSAFLYKGTRLGASPIQPGKTVEGFLVFDIPEGQKPDRLEFTGEIGQEPVMVPLG
ncbi:MAG: DUF4352 domain-containing protein, partial [Micrococcales bacterium]|nr:DUF4352 domain-containing protein [Micrococcales bacterium]